MVYCYAILTRWCDTVSLMQQQVPFSLAFHHPPCHGRILIWRDFPWLLLMYFDILQISVLNPLSLILLFEIKSLSQLVGFASQMLINQFVINLLFTFRKMYIIFNYWFKDQWFIGNYWSICVVFWSNFTIYLLKWLYIFP